MQFFQFIAMRAPSDADEAVGRAFTDDNRPLMVFLFKPEGERFRLLSSPAFVKPIEASVAKSDQSTVLAALSADTYSELALAVRSRLGAEPDRELVMLLADEPIVAFHPGRIAVSVLAGLPHLDETDLQRFILHLVVALESGAVEKELIKLSKRWKVKEFITHRAEAAARFAGLFNGLGGR